MCMDIIYHVDDLFYVGDSPFVVWTTMHYVEVGVILLYSRLISLWVPYLTWSTFPLCGRFTLCGTCHVCGLTFD